jgi:AI-2 transport protein TqsA
VSEVLGMQGNDQSVMRVLQAAAFVVVVAWGIKAASHILSVILIALLLTYAILPFPKWLMRRFRLRKGFAILLTAVLVLVLHFVMSIALVEGGLRMRDRLPMFEEHTRAMYERVTGFLSAHGVQSADLLKNLYSADRIVELSKMILPGLVSLVSDRFLVALLAIIFLAEMVESEGPRATRLARHLAYYGGDVQRFIAISAQTGGINALANLVILVALGVDFAVVWCFLYFFLHFIPNLGFLLSIIPPSLVALVTLGWKRALLVAGCLILTEMLGDYVLKPMMMIKGLHVSMMEIMLSLIVWGFLLGPAGAILAIPLTLVLRRLIEKPRMEESTAAVNS